MRHAAAKVMAFVFSVVLLGGTTLALLAAA